MSFDSDVITLERDGHVATVWLDRPDKRNAMGKEFWDDLPRAIAELGDDDGVRAIVIAAKGPSFTVGLDLVAFAELGSGEGSPVRQRRDLLDMIRRMQWTMTSIDKCDKPVIAAIHGYCLGGGIDLITACDIRIASADAVFSIRETKLAMVADVGTLQRLPRIVGTGHTAELAFTGKDIGADRAKEIGLVNDVYADADATRKAAMEMAHEIATNSPLAVQGTKHVLRAADGKTVDEALEFVSLWNAAFIQSNDLVEAMAAFVQKRPPEFTGD